MKYHKKILNGKEFLELAESEKKGEATVFSWAVDKMTGGFLVDWSEPDRPRTIFDVAIKSQRG